MKHLLALLSLVIIPLAADAAQFVYVSIAGENRIAVYVHEQGKLTPAADLKLSGGPGALCVHPNGKYLFASVRSVGNLAGFEINDDGSLRQINEVAAGADPAYVATDRSGKYLLSAYYRAGKVMVHAIDDTGKISQRSQSISTDDKAHAIVSDRSGKFVFVPHTGPNAIFQFRFDAATGKLTANQPAKLVRPENTGPRHLWFHPRADFAYGSDEQGNSVTAYAFDSTAGTLRPIQTLSSLPPAGFQGTKSTSDIEVHPSGKLLYIANRGHDSISCYAVGEESGRLRYLSNTKTEKTPRSFNIDPSGQYLIAAGQNSATLATYRIKANGTLDLIGTTATGTSPWWVLIVDR